MRIEDTILQNLFNSEKYCRTVVPFLKPEYFADSVDRHVVEEFLKFFNQHNHPATSSIISLELRGKKGISDAEIKKADELMTGLPEEVSSHDWAIEKTEDFCQKRSVYNAIVESIGIIDGSDKKHTEDAIPKLLADALAVSFNIQVGHDYIEDAEKRYDFYTQKEDRIPFGIDELDESTGGGMVRKALYCVASPSGGGKSIMTTHVAANALKLGKNVLYITMEMSEERTAERIDANLMNVDIDTLKDMPRDIFKTKIANIASKGIGRLFIKEYPTGGAHSGHFRGLIEELKTKQNFIPDLLVVDYLGICSSARMRMGGSVNTYSFQKSVAEELRGLGVEYNVPVLTCQQLNRGAYGSSDVDMSNTADSLGVAMSLDYFFALVNTPELEEMDQVLVQVLKNRYGAVDKFIIGLKKRRMQFYNLEASAQNSFIPKTPDSIKSGAKERDVPLFDRSNNNKTIDGSGFKF